MSEKDNLYEECCNLATALREKKGEDAITPFGRKMDDFISTYKTEPTVEWLKEILQELRAALEE